MTKQHLSLQCGYWTTKSSFLTPHNNPIHKGCRKFDENCNKTLKLVNFGFCVIFVVNLRFTIYKTARISSEKTTGHRVFAMICFFSIPIFEVFRKIDTNCKRNDKKLENFGRFMIFEVILGHFLF